MSAEKRGVRYATARALLVRACDRLVDAGTELDKLEESGQPEGIGDGAFHELCSLASADVLAARSVTRGGSTDALRIEAPDAKAVEAEAYPKNALEREAYYGRRKTARSA